MKILRLTTLLDFGGQEKQFLSFTEKKELLHNEYIFAAIGYGGNAEKILQSRGFDVRVLNLNYSIRNLSNIWKLYKLIKSINPDIVHTAAAEANLQGIIAAKLAGVKVIIGEEIGISNHASVARKIFKLVYKFADKVICVSKSVKTHLINMGEIDFTKGEVIYNPVSIPKKFSKISSDSFQIVYVGRLEKVKNVDTLIRAFSQITKSNVHLTIVGEGRESKYLKNIAKHKDLLKKITFTGYTDEPAQYLCSADLFILPSYSEGFGIAAVEAMFLKLPVLCSNVGGIPEFVHEDQNGWLFDPNDEKELVEKLNKIIEMDQDSLQKIGQNAYDAAKKFSVENYITTLEQFYNTFHI